LESKVQGVSNFEKPATLCLKKTTPARAASEIAVEKVVVDMGLTPAYNVTRYKP